jgi:hypothetical protein
VKFGAFVSRIKRKSLIIFLFLYVILFLYSLLCHYMHELDPGMHIVMHLVFFGKTGVTTKQSNKTSQDKQFNRKF